MVLRFEGVSYRYEGAVDWTLRGLDLSVSPGEYVLIAGASGSGKSTLCRASVGLIPHFHGGELSGRITVAGMDTRQHPVHRLFGHVGLVFQNPDAQLFNRTVESELVYGLESLGLGPAETERRLTWAVDLAGLGPLLSRSPQNLSGGEKQKVALAATLALRPRLLLLDEPFTHLDPEAAERLRTILRAVREEGIAVVVVEHRLHEVIGDVDRLVVLHQGQRVEDGPPREVLRRDLSEYGLNLPPLVRLFRHWGWQGIPPLNVSDAIHLLNTSDQGLPLRSRLEEGEARSSELLPPVSAGPRPNEGSPLVEMEKVRFGYNGDEVLREVSLKLFEGECVALLGRNGAGKTTLLKHLNGLLRPRQGEIHVLGRDARTRSTAELARHVGFAWQNPNDQLFQTSVRAEVLTGPRVLKAYDSAWCEHLFERFALHPLLERSPFRLSEGEKKRVAFATALAARPELIVLDEPTAGQDEPFRRELGSLIRELRKEGRTILLVTHDVEFASDHATRWLVLGEGRILADGRSEDAMEDDQVMTAAGLRPAQGFQLLRRMAERKGDRSW